MNNKPSLKRERAGRYKGDEDDEGAGIVLALMGPPAVCVVFEVPDEDEGQAEDIQAQQEEVQMVVGRLRSLNLSVEKFESSDKKHLYLKVSANDAVLKYEATDQRYRCKLKNDHGGAMCGYTMELDEKNAFDKPRDGFAVFNSAQQLKMILSMMESEPYDDSESPEPLRLKDRAAGKYADKLFDGRTFVREVFPLHHQRIRFKLESEWARATTRPQPLSLIREYFGEKLALFFTFHGYYMSMLCIPALIGILYSVARVFTGDMAGSFIESPLMPVMCIVISLWANLFVKLWANLENAKKFEWDTLEYELEEAIQEQFKNSPKTVKATMDDGKPNESAHVHPVTGEIEEYYYDDGQWFPIPTYRARSQTFSYLIIIAANCLSIFINVCLWKFVARPIMGAGTDWTMVCVGSLVMGMLSAVCSFVIDGIMDGMPSLDYDGLMVWLIDEENWKTETEDEDATIFKTFLYKVVNKYFALVYVAFAVNHVEVFGSSDRCPDWQCFPVVWVMFITVLFTATLLNALTAHWIPAIKEQFFEHDEMAEMRKKAGLKPVQKTPMEEQHELEDTPKVIFFYRDVVFEFGFAALFGVVEPSLIGLLFLWNVYMIRENARTVIIESKRPERQCASDIGSYMQVLSVLATLSILTNAALLGFTSSSLYYYFPTMTDLDRVWATAILEHTLLLCKLVMDTTIPSEAAGAKAAWEEAQAKKDKMLRNWGIKDPDPHKNWDPATMSFTADPIVHEAEENAADDD